MLNYNKMASSCMAATHSIFQKWHYISHTKHIASKVSPGKIRY